MIDMNIDFASVMKAVSRGAAFAGNPTEAMQFAAKRMLHDSLSSFVKRADPTTGRPWAPWQLSTQLHRYSRSPLYRTAKLRNNVRIKKANSTEAIVACKVKYAGAHQAGSRPHYIPRRPFKRKYLVFEGAYNFTRSRGGGALGKPGGRPVLRGRQGLVYARQVHHPGTPARPFIGVSTESLRLITRYFITRLAGRG